MTTRQLEDVTGVITGAQQGIGQAVALTFAQAGADLVLNWLDDEAGINDVAETARSFGVRVTTHQSDVSSSDSVNALFEHAAAFGKVGLLVNNAAIFPRVPFLDMTEADWDSVLDVNLKGSFLCAQQAAKAMVASGTGGAIINLTSGAAFRSSPSGAHYVSSKAGVVGLTRALALELAPHQIRVNAIAPGLTDTAQPRYGMTEDEISHAAIENPLGRIATAEDIARTALFLASRDARHISGQTLHVNGAQYLY